MRLSLAIVLVWLALTSCGQPAQFRGGEGEGEGEGEEGEGESNGTDFACALEIASVNESAQPAGIAPLVEPGDDVGVRIVTSNTAAISATEWAVDGPDGVNVGVSNATDASAHVIVPTTGSYIVFAEATKPNAPRSLCAVQFVARVIHDVVVNLSWDEPNDSLGMRATRVASGATVDSADPGDTLAFPLIGDTDVSVELRAGALATTATARLFVDGALEREVLVPLDGSVATTRVFALQETEGVYCVDDALDELDECSLD
jgi:hypothetical protein